MEFTRKDDIFMGYVSFREGTIFFWHFKHIWMFHPSKKLTFDTTTCHFWVDDISFSEGGIVGLFLDITVPLWMVGL